MGGFRCQGERIPELTWRHGGNAAVPHGRAVDKVRAMATFAA
jgi:hypothetical protein